MKDYKLINILTADPFSNIGGGLEEEEFWNSDSYFVKLDYYKQKQIEVDNIISNAGFQIPLSVFLYGYMGTGKTTYLRWYLKNNLLEYKKIIFDLGNISEQNNKPGNGLEIFDIYFRHIILVLFGNSPDCIDNILSKIQNNRSKIRAISFSNQFFDNMDVLFNNKTEYRITNSDFERFIMHLKYDDLFLFILLIFEYNSSLFSNFMNYIHPQESNKLIIVFDNIDHVKIEHTNAVFPSAIEDIFYVKFLNVLKNFNRQSELSVFFIFVLRDTNCSLINVQMGDMFGRHKVEFNPSCEISNVINKRIETAQQNSNISDINKSKNILNSMKTISNSKYLKEVLVPLFNFDIRKIGILLGKLNSSNNNSLLQYNKLVQIGTSNTFNGANGVLYFWTIQELFAENFLRETLFWDDGNLVVGEGGHVNPARIILTDLHNLSQFSMTASTHNIHVNPVGLYDLYVRYAEIFKGADFVDQFLKTLARLFLLHKNIWCHLVTFSAKQVFDENSFAEETEALSKLVKSELGNASADEKVALNRIRVQLNPSGYIYLRDIIKHYEFFSVRANNPKPLFESLTIEDSSNTPEFLSNIDNTLNLTKNCLNSLLKFTFANVVPNFINSIHCFKLYEYREDDSDDYHERPGRLLITRIIHTHLRYIDDFRKYIMEKGSYTQELKKNFNLELIQREGEYIQLLKKLQNKGSFVEGILTHWKNNIDQSKNDPLKYKSLLSDQNRRSGHV